MLLLLLPLVEGGGGEAGPLLLLLVEGGGVGGRVHGGEGVGVEVGDAGAGVALVAGRHGRQPAPVPIRPRSQTRPNNSILLSSGVSVGILTAGRRRVQGGLGPG